LKTGVCSEARPVDLTLLLKRDERDLSSLKWICWLKVFGETLFYSDAVFSVISVPFISSFHETSFSFTTSSTVANYKFGVNSTFVLWILSFYRPLISAFRVLGDD